MSPYCPSCGDEIGGTENFCPECGLQIQGENSPTTGLDRKPQDQREYTGPPPSDKWHFGVASPLIVFSLGLVLSFLIGFMEGAGTITTPASNYLIDLISGFWMLSILVTAALAPVSVYFDKKYLKQSIGWEPSSLYYSTALPFLNIVIAIGYLWQRHKAENASMGSRHTASVP